jgi:hypothetical protein
LCHLGRFKNLTLGTVTNVVILVLQAIRRTCCLVLGERVGVALIKLHPDVANGVARATFATGALHVNANLALAAAAAATCRALAIADVRKVEATSLERARVQIAAGAGSALDASSSASPRPPLLHDVLHVLEVMIAA